MIYLVNPSGSKRVHRGGARRGGVRRKATAKQLAARRAFAERYGGKAGTGKRVKARRASTTTNQRRSTGGTMAVRKRTSSKRRRSAVRRKSVRTASSTTKRRRRKYHAVSAHKRKGTSVRAYHQNPKRRRRRSYGFRRNPGGVVGQIIGAAKDVAIVVVGKAATNYISRMVPFGGTSRAMTAGKKIAIAVGLSLLAKKVSNQRTADLILVGGILGPVEDFASTLPVIGTALTSDSTVATTAAIGAYMPAFSALPSGGSDRFSNIGRPGMGSYVNGRSATGGGY